MGTFAKAAGSQTEGPSNVCLQPYYCEKRPSPTMSLKECFVGRGRTQPVNPKLHCTTRSCKTARRRRACRAVAPTRRSPELPRPVARQS